MGVRIIQGEDPWDGAVLYCSTSMWAFGPVFENKDAAMLFLDWLGLVDPRTLSDNELELKHIEWLTEKQNEELGIGPYETEETEPETYEDATRGK